MHLGAHVDAFRRDLASIAAVGGAEATAVVERLAAAVESSLRLRVLEILADAARELEAQLEDAAVEVRLEEREPSLVVVAEDDPAERPADDELSARITLRLPEPLKRRVEAAAADEGLSVNSWLVRALDRSLDGRRARRLPTRVTGFARS